MATEGGAQRDPRIQQFAAFSKIAGVGFGQPVYRPRPLMMPHAYGLP